MTNAQTIVNVSSGGGGYWQAVAALVSALAGLAGIWWTARRARRRQD